ncbi:glycosyltransferase [Paenibacillus macerans]|uniref:glycosyltransferase n=1 Tax=Paenibacillus macerans TaxID=44252 RepID=UPI003D3111D7
MRMLFVISSLGIGGEQKAASILTDAFIKQGHDIDILVLNKKEEKHFTFNSQIDINYAECDKYRNKNIRKFSVIFRKIRTGNYDAIIGFAVIPSILCSLCAPFTRVPVFVCERNDPAVYPARFKMLRYVAYRYATGAVFQTSEAEKHFDFLPRLKKVVIPNPLDITHLPQVHDETRNPRIVNTARLVNAKNQEIIIEAFSRVCKKHPEFTVAIYGDGPNKQRLENLITQKHLEDRITIYEAVPNILDIIRKDAIFVLSSNNEGFPNSLAEALALGIPSISTNCRIGGPKDMIQDSVNGFLVPVGDVDHLQSALDRLMSDDELRRQFSKKGVEIREKLSSEIIASRWLQFIEATV